MDAYTLLLVDDEEDVISVIIRKIDWKAIGFSVVGYASNGVKALELVEELQPDVIMTDIRMPYMDGIELARRVRVRYPETKILFFTGFDEFEYAKEAIHLEAEDYILKPVNAQELTDVYTQLREKLTQEINEKRNVEELQKYYLESLPLLQANFYSMLIEGKMNEEEYEKYLADYQVSFAGAYYCCVVVHTSSTRIPEGMRPLLLATSVRRLVKERLADPRSAKCFSYMDNTVVLVELSSENEVSELTNECDRFCRYVRRVTGAVVTVGIGQVCDEPLALGQSYSGAREAVSFRVIYGGGGAINIREIAPQKTRGQVLSSEAELAGLFKLIGLNEKARIGEAADRYLNNSSFSGKSVQQHQIAVMGLVKELYRFAMNNSIDMEEFLGDIGSLYRRLLDFEPEVLRQWLVDTGEKLCDRFAEVRKNSSNSFVLNAKEYVYSNYANEGLSLDDVCEALGVSNSYFSTIFKKETGKSFITYLTDYRMELAARLLMETDEKNYMIAQRVGYADPNYFSYVFKRQFGVSPAKYRMEHTKSEH